jgi:hypothetical protein
MMGMVLLHAAADDDVEYNILLMIVVVNGD